MLNLYSLSAHYVPSALIDTEIRVVSDAEMVPVFLELTV